MDKIMTYAYIKKNKIINYFIQSYRRFDDTQLISARGRFEQIHPVIGLKRFIRSSV